MILSRAFYERDIIEVSRDLLGKILVHETAEGKAAGRIVEVEAYRGPEDQAAHSFGGRRTTRNEVMYGEKGHAYVYFIYGMYHCINATAGCMPGKPEAVLIRALEPLGGLDLMAKRRHATAEKTVNLTNGPGRLCMALEISKAENAADLTASTLYIDDAPNIHPDDVVASKRIGVDYAGEWKDKLWRFHVKNNKYVSK
jgi:DNA-3-methyladenine glycosylase